MYMEDPFSQIHNFYASLALHIATISNDSESIHYRHVA